MIEDTLKRIDNDVQKGDLGKARDRFHGLIKSYPNELFLRKKLSEIYIKLQFPSMAGRYAFLIEEKTEEMIRAVKIFEKSCNDNPMEILRAIKYQGNIDELKNSFAKNALLTLQEKCKKNTYCYPEFGKKGVKEWKQSFIQKLKDKLFLSIVLFLFLCTIVFTIIGLITFIKWLI